jgi:Zn-dependent peptidase ImmA (M78 family)
MNWATTSSSTRDNILLTDENGCLFDKTREKEANFLAAEFLVPYQAALKAAFAEKTNDEIAATYGISTQFGPPRGSWRL